MFTVLQYFSAFSFFLFVCWHLSPWHSFHSVSIMPKKSYKTFYCWPFFFLIVPAVNFITTPRNTTAAVGKSIVLRCNATGLPTSEISWGRERGKLDKKRFRQLANGNLHIRDIKMTDAGQYFCIAANIHDLKEVKVTLRVIGKRFVCTTIFRKLMTSFASWILHSRYWIWDSFSVKVAVRIQIIRRIPDFLSCTPDSKAPDCRF